MKRLFLSGLAFSALIVPAIVDEKTWIPELGREDLLYHRLFLAEKWLVLKLRYGHADPREAGVGKVTPDLEISPSRLSVSAACGFRIGLV